MSEVGRREGGGVGGGGGGGGGGGVGGDIEREEGREGEHDECDPEQVRLTFPGVTETARPHASPEKGQPTQRRCASWFMDADLHVWKRWLLYRPGQ